MTQGRIQCLAVLNTVGLQKEKSFLVNWETLAAQAGLCSVERLRWSRGSVLAFGTQVSEFKPGRSRRIFKGK